MHLPLLLLQLEEEKKLSLDDTVARGLPAAARTNGYDGSGITIRQLLDHASGLPDCFQALQISGPYVLTTSPREVFPPQNLVDVALGRHAPTSEPGERRGCATTGYLLAGGVIKAVTGSEPATEVQRRVIGPPGPRDTALPASDPALRGNHLHGYVIRTLFIHDGTASNVQVCGSAGALAPTLDDMARFSRALMAGKLLKPAQMAELKTTVPVSDGVTYGLGTSHTKLPCGTWAWRHNGAVLGCFAGWLGNEHGTEQVLHANNEYHLVSGTPGRIRADRARSDAFCAL
ncbi:serine hydrolase domain-containing protein [Streptomyces sp. NPDC058195]|uniref:serine hydrolase domain-containing protein n=1 Tax=Streptomyces sp. NPDC058195 TaxID=3346375 RepID=UPI0036EEE70C